MANKGSKLSTLKGRQEYNRTYYQLHKEKAKEYQRKYSRGKRNSTTRGHPNGKIRKKIPYKKEVIKSSYSGNSLQHLTVNKLIKVVNMIINSEVVYTGIMMNKKIILGKK